MGALLRRIARTCILLMAIGLAGSWCAFAQSPKATPAAEKPAASDTPAAENLTPAAQAANPAINTKDIDNRLNQELGIDLQAGWQHALVPGGKRSRPRGFALFRSQSVSRR